MKYVYTFILSFCVALVSSACSFPIKTSADDIETSAGHNNGSVKPVTECHEPRSPRCTREYAPVCATRDTNMQCVTTPCPATEDVTYANGCSACADTSVRHYRLGACEP
mgnify:CR=1 FL=1